MPFFEVLCLANSKKHGGRCVAGLRTDGGGWLRPVAPGEDGALFPQHYLLPDGSEPCLFDLLRIEVSKPVPRPHQPENWLISGSRWELLARPAPMASTVMRACIESGPVLFGSFADRIPYDELLRLPARASLALIAPEELKWRVGMIPGSGKAQLRAHFRLDTTWYDLAITDPICLGQLCDLAIGTYPAAAAGIQPGERALLTVSLGEPYDGACYKLVAAVAGVPDSVLAVAAPDAPRLPRSGQASTAGQPVRDPHLAEFGRARGTALRKRLVEAFSLAAASGATEDEAVQRLRDIMEDVLRERLCETAGD